jgi:hypothetical protein
MGIQDGGMHNDFLKMKCNIFYTKNDTENLLKGFEIYQIPFPNGRNLIFIAISLYHLSISHHIQSNIHSPQFAFVNGRSCATQLLSILNIIRKNLARYYNLTLFLRALRRLSTLLTTPTCCKICVNLVSLVLFSSGFRIIYQDASSG